MKQTKRILSLLLAVIMTVSLFTVSVGAATSTSDRETKAQVLFALGLFKGYDSTGTNFGLSDGVTREQALLFLIRILGEEKAAAAWTGTQPYSDVPSSNYYCPYIGYAKSKGYTNGIGSNMFGLGQSANMTQMVAFALRGLGYSEAAGDFTYPNSVPFAVSLGILDSSDVPATFTRGDAVDILDGAVAANVKGQSYTLLEKLVSLGAVTQEQVEKAAAIADGKPATTQPQSDIAAGTYTLKLMGNNVRVTSGKLELRDTTPAQTFTITNINGYSYIQTDDGYYIGITSLANGTQLVTGTTPYSWLIQKQSGSTYTIRPAEKTGMVVNASEEKSANGTKILIWPHSGAPKNALITFTAATEKVAVTAVKLDQSTATVAVGKTTQLSGTISPANATNQNVTWSSSAPTIAKVDASGKVTGLKAGTATITVKTADGNKTATCQVTVTAAETYTDKKVNFYNSTALGITDLRISSTQNRDWGSNLVSSTVAPDASVAILVPVSTTDYTYDILVTYTDGSTATFAGYNFKSFTSGGNLYAYFSGTTPMLSTTKPTKVDPTSVTLDKTTLTLAVGETYDLTAKLAPVNSKISLTWSTSDPSVATVGGTGVVKGIKAGTAVITVKTHNGKTATCTITVTASKVAVTGIKLDQTNATVAVGASGQITGTVSPANATNQSVTWTSSNPSVATVDGNGVVMGVKAGTATITAKTVDGGKTATCTITVTAAKVAVTGIKLDQTNATVAVGETGQITGTVSPANATDQSVTWTSSNPSIATVDSNGVVTGVKAGTVTITAKTVDGGKTATCTITVTGGADTTADSAKLLKRYNTVVARFNTTQETLKSVGLYTGTLKTDWENFAKQLNTNLGFIGSGTGVYTVEQITTANAILDEVDKMLNEMDKVIAEAKATAPTTITVPVTFVNNTGVAITGIFFTPTSVKDWGTSMGSLNVGDVGVVNINVDSNSLKWDLKLVDGNNNPVEFSGLDFSGNNASGITITLTMQNDQVTASW